MRKLELKHLEYFLAVANNLSFTKAAEEIHVAQPAISQQIKYLEFVLGVPLFNRDNKKVTLTEAGALFEQQAIDVLEAVDKAVRVIEELRGLERGSVSIGMSSTMATVLMADLVMEFKEKFPDIKIRISESMSVDSMQRIRNGELDLAILTISSHLQQDSSIHIEHLYEEELEAIVPARHPLALKGIEEVTLKELNSYRWILANVSNSLRRIINEACEGIGFCPLVPIEVDRINAVKNLLLFSDDGVSILPPTVVWNELSLGLVKRIKLSGMHIKRAVGVASRQKGLLPPATVQMIGVIKEICLNYPDRIHVD